MKKEKKDKPEILHFSPKFADLFMEVVKKTEEKTFISNESIFKLDERTIEIHSTRAYFLIEVGQQYQKLIYEKAKNN